MARTESLMGNGRLYLDGKASASSAEVKYQLQVTTEQGAASIWEGFMRLPVGKMLPGTNSASPPANDSYILVLEDNEGRTGHIQIERAFGQAGGFHNYSIRGEGT